MSGIYYIGYGIYISRKMDANNLAALKARKISHVLTLGKENVPASKDTSSINYHLFDITDKRIAPWDTFLKDEHCVEFIENFLAKQTNRLLVHCNAGQVRSAFAVRCILIRFFNFTPFQARARLMSVYPRFVVYPCMLKVEVELCTRPDKENDFGLREHPLAKSKAPDDKKQAQFAHRSFFIIRDPDLDSPQRKLDGKDASFNKEQLELYEGQLQASWLTLNDYFRYEVDEHFLPFMDFGGCIPDKVPVKECVLNTANADGKIQFFPET